MNPLGPSHSYMLKKMGISSPLETTRITRKKGGPAKRAGGGAMPQTSGGMQQSSPDIGQMSPDTTQTQTNPIQRKPMISTPKQFSGFVSKPPPIQPVQPMQTANPQPQTQSFNDPNAQAQPNAQLRKGGKVRGKAKRNS